MRLGEYTSAFVASITSNWKEDSTFGEDELLSSAGKKYLRREHKKFHCADELELL